jgi:peroxiredoxin Q/BCP
MLKAGDKAPTFSLDTQSGTQDSADLQGMRYVLYFYPADDTPGCTKEACNFRDNLVQFSSANVPVFGVSPQNAASKQKFAKKFDLNFPLLADLDHKLADAYGVWVEKSMYGKKYMGVQRSTFVIGQDGAIEHVWEKVSPEGHALEVLSYLSGDVATQAPAKAAKTRAAKAGITRAPASGKKTKPKASAAKKTPTNKAKK